MGGLGRALRAAVGPAGRKGEGRSRESLLFCGEAAPLKSHDRGGRLRPSGPERPDGPVELRRAVFVARGMVSSGAIDAPELCSVQRWWTGDLNGQRAVA